MKNQYDKIPTHFICHICGKDDLVVTKKGAFYSCPKCKQRYQMVLTKYGYFFVLIGEKV
jgi:transcription elongation factor Elf1